jgi:hypothetical protein
MGIRSDQADIEGELDGCLPCVRRFKRKEKFTFRESADNLDEHVADGDIWLERYVIEEMMPEHLVV